MKFNFGNFGGFQQDPESGEYSWTPPNRQNSRPKKPRKAMSAGTMVKNPGKEDMEIIVKQGQNIDRYTPSDDQSKSGQRGKRVGIAYELENGEIIYVPE